MFIFSPLFFVIPIIFFFSIYSQRRGYRRPTNISGIRNKTLGPQNLPVDISDEQFEVYIYRLAEKHHGRLTAAKIVVDTGLPVGAVERRMNSMVDNVHIRMEVSDDGLLHYEFPELMAE